MHRCGTGADRRNCAIPEGLVELLHGGLPLELMWLSFVELIVELMELCSV